MKFDRTARERLSVFLDLPTDSPLILQLTPDASTREFFRIEWNGSTAIACVYPERFDESLPQIDVTNLFLACGLPVARIFAVEYDAGIVIHEDFGDRILRDELVSDVTRQKHFGAAVGLIAQIQAGTANAFEMNSIASRLKFDEEKLTWELNFFRTHYFRSLKKIELESSFERVLGEEFAELSREIEGFSGVLTHRDFHAANLMVCGGELRIIDHQDARIGPASYDLVSLLLDRIEEQPEPSFLKQHKDLLQTKRASLGLPLIKDFNLEFELVTIQRCLKAIGTFSNQTANFGKSSYVKYIRPMFGAAGWRAEIWDGIPR